MAEEKISGIIADNIENIVTDVLENYSRGKVIDKENIFHLDNDEMGRSAAEGIKRGLKRQYRVWNQPPRQGKDVNEYLTIRKALR